MAQLDAALVRARQREQLGNAVLGFVLLVRHADGRIDREITWPGMLELKGYVYLLAESIKEQPAPLLGPQAIPAGVAGQALRRK